MATEGLKKGFSPTLWLPTLWVLLSVSRIGPAWDLTRLEAASDIDFLGGSLLLRSSYLLLMAAGIVVLAQRKINWIEVLQKNFLILLLFAYMGMSILWSDFAGVAAKRWIKAVGMLIMIFVLYSSDTDLRRVFHRFFNLTFAIILSSSLVVIFLFPRYGISEHTYYGTLSWVGITMHKNGLAQVAMICAAYYLWFLIISRSRALFSLERLLLVLALILLVGAESMTSLVIFVAVSVLIISIHYLKLPATHFFVTIPYLIVMGLLTLACLHFVFFDGQLFSGALEMLGRDATLTGRIDLWQDVLAYAWERPLFGYGFGSFWIGDLGNDLWAKYVWLPNQAHNGYIDTFISLGIFGLILLGVVIVRSFYNITRELPGNYAFAMIRIYLLLMIISHNLTESSLCRLNHFLWFLFLLVVVRFPMPTTDDHAETPY